MNTKRNIGILIFENAEVLDIAGPFEVFSVTSELNNFELFDVFTVSEKLNPVTTVNGLSINPKYDFNTCPNIDILIISGGFGTRALLDKTNVLNWIEKVSENTEFTVSICSGAMLLGKIGLLEGKPYCTHHEVYEYLNKLVPSGFPQPDKRYVNAGKLYTSGGISAGIDLSFHLVKKLFGKKIAIQTAKYMEYNTTI